MTERTEQSSAAGSVLAGLFGDPRGAAKAMAELKADGFGRVEISETDAGATADTDVRPASDVRSGTAVAPLFFQEHDSGASSFHDELTGLGFSKHDAHDLVDGLVDGGAVVTADAGARLDRAAEILTQNFADVRYTRGAEIPATAAASGEQDETLRLRAERLAIDTRRVQHGEARIRKEVVTHMESIEVPVTREELVIEQVAFDGNAPDGGVIDAAETVRIPLSQERVQVTKTVESTGDVVIGKRQVRETQHVSETLREERLTVDGQPASPTFNTPSLTES